MGEFLQSVAQAIAVLLVLGFVGAVAYVKFQEKYELGNWSPYAPHNIPFSFHLERYCEEQTLFGFKTCFLLGMTVEVDDQEEYTRNRMKAPSSRQAFIDAFYEEVVRPALDERYFFTFDPTGSQDFPILSTYKEEDGRYTIERAGFYGKREGEESFEKKVEDVKFQKWGCRVYLVIFQLLHAPREENYRMLDQKTLAKIREDNHYQEYLEAIAVSAVQDRYKIRQEHLERTYAGEYDALSITTELAGDSALKVSWRMAKAYSDENSWSVLGFRREGSFSPEAYNRTENGQQIIESAVAADSRVISLTPGTPHFLTFFLYRRRGERFTGLVRFEVTIDKEDFRFKEEKRRLAREYELAEATEKQVDVQTRIARYEKRLNELLGKEPTSEEADQEIRRKRAEKIHRRERQVEERIEDEEARQLLRRKVTESPKIGDEARVRILEEIDDLFDLEDVTQ